MLRGWEVRFRQGHGKAEGVERSGGTLLTDFFLNFS